MTSAEIPRAHRPIAVSTALVLVALASACTPDPRVPPVSPWFLDATAAIEPPLSVAEWPPGRYRIPEISMGGVALFDHDGDGDLDIYRVLHPPPDAPDAPAPNRLFRNEGGERFVEVEGAAGLADPGYGSGVAVGDVNGDGHLDVYVTNLAADALYLNQGDGTLADATARSGIVCDEWSSCASFLDHDRDGDLDLYVSCYLVDDPSRVCRPGSDAPRDYCGPARYQGVPDRLFRNNGDGTFADVTREAGIRGAWPGFGVVCVDLTGDGWVDIYVANDKKPNQLYVNRRNGTFEEQGFELAAALNGAGKAEASMGVAVGDVDIDGDLDLLLTHLVDETNTFYEHLGAAGGFRDRSASSGLGAPSLAFTGWGCGFADFDHDGDLDLAVVNGRVARGPVHPGAGVGPFWKDYAEPDQLFVNDGGGRAGAGRAGGGARFVDASAFGGDFTAPVEVGRGLALGDLDGDGDVDLVTTDVGRGLRVFRNVAPKEGRHWLAVRALTGQRDALGALVTVEAGGVRRVRPILTGSSFASASEAVARFGLGTATSVTSIEVRWPDGSVEQFAAPGVDRLVVVRQGHGE